MQKPLIFLGLPLLIGCASGDNSAASSDASADGTFDVAAPVDQYVPPPEAGGQDVVSEPPPATDDGSDGSGDDGSDAAAEAGEAGCAPLGQLCDTNAVMPCPFFLPDGGLPYVCMSAFDDGGIDGGDAGTFDGLCVSAFRLPLPCDDGSGSHCIGIDKCLQASQLCLTDQETLCICNNPQTMSACGPP